MAKTTRKIKKKKQYCYINKFIYNNYLKKKAKKKTQKKQQTTGLKK